MSKTSDQSVSPVERRLFTKNSRLLGNWQLECLAGRGTLTNLYFARPLGCPPDGPADYAVKMLKRKYEQDQLALYLIKRECEVGRHLSNSHLLPILESSLQQAPYYLVMPRIVGASLNKAIAAVGRITTPQALWITRQISLALRQMHQHGWIHADVKPANIIVSKEGHATLIDFGCALRPQESIYSNEQPIVGTMHYVAPEMLTSKLRTDCRCDIYSLGVSLYEMLSGRLPFPESDQGKLIEAHLSKDPPNLRVLHEDIPEDVAELVARMLEKDPLGRPQSTNELIDLLTDLEIETLDMRVAA